jgi:signal transduction histidine kinase/CheY-like chemotaxis protein
MDSKNLPSLKEELRFHIDENTLLVRADQIRTRIAAYPVMIASQALLSAALVWMMWGVIPERALVAWLGAILVGLALDARFLIRHRAAPLTVAQCRTWARHFVWMVSLLGALWGSAGVLMFTSGQLDYQALLICVLLGLAAGAVTINPVYVPAMFIWEALVLLPVTLRTFAEGDKIHLALGSMLVLYFVTVLNDGYKLSRVFLQALLRGHENTELLQDLSREKAISEAAREKAEAASREKSRFLASASHDLRQPLQALVLFSDALNGHVRGRDAIAQKLAGQIDSAVNSLNDMFSALLNISRLEAGVTKPQLQHFNLQSLLDRLYVEFHRLALEKTLDFNIPPCPGHPDGVVVYSDPGLLEQILRNLASNAVRYTRQGGVAIRCQMEEGQIRLYVTDTGIGISPEDVAHIFDEYFQADNPQRDRRQGLGLGLSIVRKVEKLLGYRIQVESELGRGTTFSFAVPLGDPALESTPYQIVEQSQDVYGTRVALLEDDPEIREATVALLESWGCIVHAGIFPDEVVASLNRADMRPDVLVSDYRLPAGVTAIHAIDRMRGLWGEDLPVLVVTGDTGAETLSEIHNHRAVLLHKPLPPNRLRAMLFQVLQQPG